MSKLFYKLQLYSILIVSIIWDFMFGLDYWFLIGALGTLLYIELANYILQNNTK